MLKEMLFEIKVKKQKIQEWGKQWMGKCMVSKHPGIDGILVTVGLCIIALVLCVIMRDGLEGFIDTIVGDMTSKAQSMLKYDAGVQ